MNDIKITVADKKATLKGTPVIVCGNSDYTVTFSFDEEWSLTGPKTARFVYVKNGEKQHEDVVFEGNTAAVPVLSDVTFVQVGVFEGNLATTTPARILCTPSILCGTGTAGSLTEDVYNQLLALVVDMAEKGSFGATEEQAQQINQNSQDITQLGEEKADRTELNALETEKANQEDVELLKARVNNLSTLEAGSTTGDAELADIRVGADGKTYENAGEAVRGQVGALEETIENDASKSYEEFTIFMYDQFLHPDGGARDGSGLWKRSDNMEIRKGASYITFHLFEYANVTNVLSFYDENTNYISGVSVYSNVQGMVYGKVEIPQNARYVRGCTKTDFLDESYFRVHYDNPYNSTDRYMLVTSVKKPITFEAADIICAGDSIMRGYLPDATITENNWINLFKDMSGANSVTNAAKGGACFVSQSNSVLSQITGESLSGKTHIIVSAGVNDYYYRTHPLLFKNALNDLAAYLANNKDADARVIFVTPFNVTITGEGLECNSLNWYREAITEVALLNGFDVIDGSVFGLPDKVNSFHEAVLTDGLHPTELGYRIIANKMSEILLSN